MHGSTDAVVIGGGLAGLAAATYLARKGVRTVVLEKATEPGGRAITQENKGFSLNLGAHALYRKGAAEEVLAELGVSYAGKQPPVSGGYAVFGGSLHTLPVGPISFLTTGLYGARAKIDLARLVTRIGVASAADLDDVSVNDWLAEVCPSPEVRAFGAAFFRVSTYCADHDRLSAGAALRQIQHVIRHNVTYLDGGWQTLVAGLRAAATSAGAEILCAARVTGVDMEGGAVTGVRLADGQRIAARHAILAVSPRAASALAPDVRALREASDRAVPVKAACLDVALSRLPREKALFGLGIDRPLYVSVHSATAKLAPEGGAVIHALTYAPREDTRADQEELEALLDKMQPGWRELVVEKRFLPSLVVSNAVVTAQGGGLKGRPGAEVPGARGLLLAGDWVGPEGMLADATLASAREAAARVGGHEAARRAA